MIQIKKITKAFQSNFWEKKFLALDDVSFHIEKGKMTGFLGANGAGKTTLMKIMMGFIRPDAGQVLFNDQLGAHQSEIFGKMAYLPERPYFYPHLSGKDFLIFMAKLNDMPNEKISQGIDYWAHRLKIDFALDRFVRGYSKGMLQRLGLASVLLHDPDLIVLDEPLSGLDPIGRKEFKDIFVELHNENKTIFFSSHIVPDIEEICDQLIVLDKGKLLYQGGVDEILKKGNLNKIEILYKKKDGTKIKKILEKKEKKKLLDEIYQEGHDLLALSSENLSLEEIIYQRSVNS